MEEAQHLLFSLEPVIYQKVHGWGKSFIQSDFWVDGGSDFCVKGSDLWNDDGSGFCVKGSDSGMMVVLVSGLMVLISRLLVVLISDLMVVLNSE